VTTGKDLNRKKENKMTLFHSTVSRREFMKNIGLAGAGLGAASLVGSGFQDMDEVMATGAEWKRDWWVKEVDEPTINIDWGLIKRLQKNAYANDRFNGDHPDAVYTRENYNKLIKAYIQKRYPTFSGDTTRDPYNDIKGGAYDPEPYSPKSVRDIAFNRAATEGRLPGIGLYYEPTNVKAPEEIGMSKWSGNPEENLNMLRAAFRVFGAMEVGCIELDADTRKLIFADNGKVPYVFEDVDKPYTTDTKWVIPNSFKYMIVWSEIQPTQLTLRNPSTLGKTGKQLSYTRMPMIVRQMYAFLHGLGYGHINGYSGDLAPSNPFGVLTGMGEHNRMAYPVIAPRYGSLLRGMNRILTDMPVASSKPIDAGLNRFCVTCKICAEDCPFQALSYDDKSWEGPDYQPTGFEGWRLDLHKCPFCDACQAVCPFNSLPNAMVHGIVRATSAITPLFNSFFTTMEKTMGYGFKDPETWWDLDSEPTYGVAPEFINKG
jgi:reductive dehalogenase